MAEEEQKELFNPDDVYKMPAIEGVDTSPAGIVKAMVPYLSEDPIRPVLRFIAIGPKWVSATDGHRFIRIERDRIAIPIPDGCYRPVKDGKDYLLIAQPHDMELPNMDLAMPAEWDTQFELEYWPKSHAGIAELLFQLAHLKTCISADYAAEIPRGKYQIRVGRPSQVVLFHSEDFIVGVMPLKVERKV